MPGSSKCQPILNESVTTTEPRSDVTVREATRADLLSVFRIEKASFAQPWPFVVIEQFLGEPGFLVATTQDGSNGETIIGYVIADTRSDSWGVRGHIKDLAVAPTHRRQGVAHHLLNRILGILATRGADRVKLEVRRSNKPAISLYEQYGFRRHHVIPGYYDDGEDAIVMEREI